MRQGPGEVDLISPLGARVQVLSREIGACWFIFRASLVALAVPGSGKIPWRRKWQPTLMFLLVVKQGGIYVCISSSGFL